MRHIKEHRAPTRYSLTPSEQRDIGAYLRIRGGITTREVRGLARRYGCAQKVIHEIADRGRIAITQIPKASSIRPRPETPEPETPEPETAEHEPDPPPDQKNHDELGQGLETLSQLEVRLREEHRRREETLLSEICALEEQLQINAAKREQSSIDQTNYAKRQVERTRRLRIATREDRQTIETLKGECSAATRKIDRLKTKIEDYRTRNLRLNRELRASADREEKLVSALEDLLSEMSEKPTR